MSGARDDMRGLRTQFGILGSPYASVSNWIGKIGDRTSLPSQLLELDRSANDALQVLVKLRKLQFLVLMA